VIERPKLLPFKPAMHQRLVAALGVTDRQLNLKATRGEGLGFVGRLEGAAAMAVATVTRPDPA
jgi:2-C-methyl-D-erythritol 2,4-cyclodiphosphate synthase